LVTDDRDKRFQDLYERYYRRVYLYFHGLGVAPDLIQDLAQDTFLRLYLSMDQYRGEAEWSYLVQMARRLAYNRMRDQNTRKRAGSVVELDDSRHAGDSILSPDDPAAELLARERAERLRAAIDDLAPGMKAVLLLWLDGASYDEIAKVARISAAAVKSRMRDARRILSAKLAALSLDDSGDDKQRTR
jgi:RNA polymerase sigma-70 factor (ECF subfamily)